MFRKSSSFIVATLLVFGIMGQVAFADNNEEFENSTCSAEMLIEASSGKVIVAENESQPLPPASMVKTMTAYVVFKMVQAGEFSWDDVVTVSAFASKVGGSQVYLKEKEEFTLKELLEALLVQSANDVAVAIAEYMGGSQSGFVEMMNAEAERLGMKETEFHSAHGLPPEKGQLPDLISAQDMITLSRALITDFPEALEFTSLSEKGFRNDTFIMRNHNHLVRTFQGCDGIKTGYYGKAGFNVSATAKRNDLRFIAVVMGCETYKKRDAEAARLLSMGFARYSAVKVIEAGQAVEEKVPVVDAKEKEISPVAKNDVIAVIRRGDKSKLTTVVTPCEKLTAPVEKGTTCGEMVVSLDGEELGRSELIVAEELPRLGFKDRILRKFGF